MFSGGQWGQTSIWGPVNPPALSSTTPCELLCDCCGAGVIKGGKRQDRKEQTTILGVRTSETTTANDDDDYDDDDDD